MAKISTYSSKTTPVDGDSLVLVDSAASNVTKRLTWANVKATLNALYAIVFATTTEVLTGTDTAKAVTPNALAALWEKGSDIASAGTISVGEGGLFHVTGTTTITDIDPATDKAGRRFVLVFDAALTLTHHATNLILPTGGNIITAAGDMAFFVSEGSDAVRCMYYSGRFASIATAGNASIGNVCAASSFFIGPITGAPILDSNANNIRWRDSAGSAGVAHLMLERTAPAAPGANSMHYWIEDNGSGKTRFMVEFATGGPIQISIQP